MWGNLGKVQRLVQFFFFFFGRTGPDHSSTSGARRAKNYHSRSLGLQGLATIVV